MTQFTLSAGTQTAINYAVANGPGTNNANYLAAYTDIYNDLVANGGVDPSVLYWFEQAGSINSAQYSPTPSAAAVYIWNFTKGAAASEGVSITNSELQGASNAIANSVFQTLQGANFVFNDAGNFSPINMVNNDASKAITALQGDFPSAGLDWAIWGGTLFAQTELGDTTFIADHNIDLMPGSRDADAMLAGLFNAAQAVTAAGYAFTSVGFDSTLSMDLPTIDKISGGSLSTGLTWSLTSGPLAGALAAGATYILNTSIGKIITISSSGSSAPGTATAYEPTNNGIVSFDEGTAGSGTLALTNGTVLSVGGTADLTLTNIQGGSDTDEAALLAYLSYIGDPLTASQLNTDNFNYQNPTGTAYTVTGSVVGSDDDFTDYTGGPGAIITGVSGKTNILSADGDLTQDTISNIQQAYLDDVTLTDAEFSGFSTITGSGTLAIASDGTYSIASKGTGFTGLTAEDWGGTTLTGSSTADQTLTASLFGNDTLTAGNGTGDVLVAGEGVDTLNGGSGGDTFEVSNDLAMGSSITGSGTGNELALTGTEEDISGATITGVQSLFLAAGIDLTVAGGQLSEFNSITGGGGESVTVNPNGGGTYSMADATLLGYLTMYADPADDTTLIGSASSYGDTLNADETGGDNTLTAASGQNSDLTAISSSGNNTLTVGNGYSDVLDVTDSTGNNNLTADDTTGVGGYGFNQLIATSSLGDNTLTAGAASYDAVSALDSFGNNTLTVGNGDNDALSVQGSSGNNTLIAGNGANDTLNAEYTSGNNTLTAGNGAGDTLYAIDSTGNNTLIAGGGAGDMLYAGGGTDSLYDGTGTATLEGGTGNDTFYIENGTAGTSVIGGSGTNTLVADAGIADISVSGVQTLDLGYYLNLGSSQFSSFSTIDPVYGSANLALQTAGTYDLSSKTVTGLIDNLSAAYASGNVTVIGNDQAGQHLTGGSFTDTLEAGNGNGDILQAGSGTETLIGGSGNDVFDLGTGVDTVTGGSGYNWIEAYYVNLAPGDVLDGGSSGGNTLQVVGTDIIIAGATLTNIQTLDVESGVTLNASQLSEFSFVNTYSTPATIYAANAGTYDFATATVTGNFNLAASLTGNTTWIADNDGQTLFDGAGVDTLEGGTGNDTFTIDYGVSGTSITGGGGSDTLDAVYGDISNLSISSVSTLETTFPTEVITMTAAQFSAFTTFVNNGSGTATINVIGTGTHSLTGKTVTGSFSVNTVSAAGGATLTVSGTATSLTSSEFAGYSTLDNTSTTTAATIDTANIGIYDLATRTVTGNFNLDASGSSANIFLIGNNQAGQTLTAGSGTDSLTAGSGGDSLYDGAGIDTLAGGTGNDTFYISNATIGTTVTGGGGTNTLVADTGDIGGISVSGVQTLDLGYYLSLNSTEFSGFSSIDATYGAANMAVETAGTYDLSGKTVTGSINLSATYASGDVTLIGNNQSSQTLTGGSFTDTLEAGTGSGDTLTAGLGNTTLIASTGNDTLNGGGGTNTYEFGSSFGADTITDAGSGGAAAGTVAFTSSSTTDEQLWFQQSGNNLVIDKLGTTDQITINNWFSGAGNDVSSFTADGMTLDTQVATLVAAMAAYQSAHTTSFNPQTATTMPTDTTLQNAIAAAWHT